jgi:hypothetical protein
MRTLTQLFVLFAVPMAAYANPDFVNVPEPETISLLGIGAMALMLSTLRTKK